MHTVCETPAFEAAAKDAGVSPSEVDAMVDSIAANPEGGDVMQGTGGCRKLRFAGRGKGKSGGYRVVTYFTGPELPVFLLTVFGKGERDNLSKAERNALVTLTQTLASAYRGRVVSMGSNR